MSAEQNNVIMDRTSAIALDESHVKDQEKLESILAPSADITPNQEESSLALSEEKSYVAVAKKVVDVMPVTELESNVVNVVEEKAVKPEPLSPVVQFFSDVQKVICSAHPKVINDQFAQKLSLAQEYLPAPDDIISMEFAMHFVGENDTHIAISFAAPKHVVHVSFRDAVYEPINGYGISLLESDSTEGIVYPHELIEQVAGIGNSDLVAQEAFISLDTVDSHMHSYMSSDHVVIEQSSLLFL